MKQDSLQEWIGGYLERQAKLLASLPADDIARWIGCLREAHRDGSRIFVCGNGSSAAN